MDYKAFFKISLGLYVVSSLKDNRYNGQIVDAVMQVSANPPKIAIALNRENLTNEFVKSSKKFSISVLARTTPLRFIGHFGFQSGRKVDKFKDINYKIGKTGVPIVLDNAVATFECEVEDELEVGTHTLFIGLVKDAVLIEDKMTMTYQFYRDVKRGKVPPQSPSFIRELDEPKPEKKVKKYVCSICGYIYNPELGDPEQNIPPGTPFEDLPDDWTCPICGASKEDFFLLKE